MPKQPQKSTAKKLHAAVHTRFKLAVVPHRANQFRPYLIRRYGLIAVLLLALIVQGADTILQRGTVLGETAKITPAELLIHTNTERTSAGLKEVKLNEKLNLAAYKKAQDMFKNQYWAHTSPAGIQPWQWLADADYNYSFAGENLAKNFTNSKTVMNAWIASPAHKENVMKPEYREIGFAVVDGTLENEPTSIVVAMYAAPATESIQGVQFAAAPSGPSDMFTRIGYTVQSASPAFIGSITTVLFAAGVAMIAHFYRHRLPRALRKSWYRHHGALKAFGLVSFVIIGLALYGIGGQI